MTLRPWRPQVDVRRLVEAAIGWAQAHGCEIIELHLHDPALSISVERVTVDGRSGGRPQ